jgi:hypothetical protein
MLNNPASLEAFPDQVTSNEPLVKFQVWWMPLHAVHSVIGSPGVGSPLAQRSRFS